MRTTAVVLAAAIACGTAQAAAESPPRFAGGDSVAMARVAGEGPSAQIELSGRGTVQLRGRLVLSGNLAARGTVSIVDRGGDASVHMAGAGVTLSRKGRATVRGATGILYVTGSNVTVTVASRGLTISAAGSGTAKLSGTGRYRLNLGSDRAWPRGTVKLTTAVSAPSRARGARSVIPINR